jgi:hypothetical protein
MNTRPAEIITLSYGSNTVELVPSLQAATVLERMHNGFVPLLLKVQQGHTGTLHQIVINSAIDRSAAQNLLHAMKGAKLISVQQALIGPAFGILTLLMTPETHKDQAEATKAGKSKPIKWADLYADLYKIATGWLGWPPATAWAATLPEILSAFDGHIEQLKAVHGTADEGTTDTPAMSADQRQSNIDAGLDPEFDRAALHALKAKIG